MSADQAFRRMAIGGEMTIYRAIELKQSLLGSGPLELDLSGVTEIDGTGVQLLLMASREAGAVRVAEASPVVREALDLLGLSSKFAAGDRHGS